MFQFTYNGTAYEVDTTSTTEKRAVAVALRDVGLSNAEIGEAFGAIYGRSITDGSAGNLVVGGLRDLGRGGEVEASRGGRSGVRLPTVEASSPAAVIVSAIEADLTKVEAARKAADELGPEPGSDEWYEVERERLNKAVERAMAAREAFDTPDGREKAVEAATKGREERAATVEAATVEIRKTVRANVEANLAALAALAKAKLVKADDLKAVEATVEASGVLVDEVEVEAPAA